MAACGITATNASTSQGAASHVDGGVAAVTRNGIAATHGACRDGTSRNSDSGCTTVARTRGVTTADIVINRGCTT